MDILLTSDWPKGITNNAGRLDRMKRMRELLGRKRNFRKPEDRREVDAAEIEDMEFRHVSRRESSRRMEPGGIRSNRVDNRLIQDGGTKLQIVGSDVAALYPSLEAEEVAKIVYNAIMETDVQFSGINYMEACRLIALTSTEQE